MSLLLDRFVTGPSVAVTKLNRYAEAIEALAQRVEELAQSEPSEPAWFLAKITGWQVFGSNENRWKYAWAEVGVAYDDSVSQVDLRVGTTTDRYALNLCELSNSSAAGTQGNSVDTSGTDFPEGFSLRPVGGGSGGTPGSQVVVMMTLVPGPGGNPRPVFQYENAVDGTCE